ncbi:hypothetical protein LUZ60_006013 [Juncus effusus]|nr:hypothetical protein LUZ60_006013 [Juncus effusus]
MCEVACSCGEEFCFGCGGEAHSPCSCAMWEMWARKCRDESETVNTKPCLGIGVGLVEVVVMRVAVKVTFFVLGFETLVLDKRPQLRPFHRGPTPTHQARETQPERELKKNLFEDQKQQLEFNMEQLSGFLEKDFQDLADSEVKGIMEHVVTLFSVVNGLCCRM